MLCSSHYQVGRKYLGGVPLDVRLSQTRTKLDSALGRAISKAIDEQLKPIGGRGETFHDCSWKK